jgi:beta-lactamase class A
MSLMPSAQRRSQFPILEIAGIGLVLISVVVLVGQLSSFSADRQQMPQSLLLGGVPVSGLSRIQAQAQLEQVYGQAVTVWYKDQEIRLDPSQVGFQVNSSSMLAQVDEIRTEGQSFWSGFWDYVWLRPEKTIEVPLTATYSEEALKAWLADIALRYDRAALSAGPAVDSLSFSSGQSGYTLDQEASLPSLKEALMRPVKREVRLIIRQEEGSTAGIQTLKSLLVEYVAEKQYRGVVSVYVIDLQSGEETAISLDNRALTPVGLDCEVAYSTSTTIKTAIMLDYFRGLDGVPAHSSDEYKTLEEMMTLPGVTAADSILDTLGSKNGQKGARHVSEMLQTLGLENTFIALPLIEDTNKYPRDIPFINTPARDNATKGVCTDTFPDAISQTTAKDAASLFDLIYQCAEYGGGGLVAAYPTVITQSECKTMVDLLEQNTLGGLISSGLPDGTEVVHRQGWTASTFMDTGTVYSPSGDYVLSIFLWSDAVGSLTPTASFPIFEGISTATFNYFNPNMVNMPRIGLGDLLNLDLEKTFP